MLENNWQVLSSIDTNSSSRYHLWSVKKWKWWITVIQEHIEWENFIFDDYEIIEYKLNYMRNDSSHYQSLL